MCGGPGRKEQGGRTAGDEPTLVSFHEQTQNTLVEEAARLRNNEQFGEMARLFCLAFAGGSEACKNDYGWLKKLRECDEGASSRAYFEWLADIGTKSRIPLADRRSDIDPEKKEEADVEAFRASSRMMKPFSLNEPYFANLKRHHSSFMQRRVDGLAACANEDQNGSFGSGGRLGKLSKLALLVVRAWAVSKRQGVSDALHQLKEEQADEALANREKTRMLALEHAREQWARSLVEWNVEVDTLQEYRAFLDSDKPHTAKIQKNEDSVLCYPPWLADGQLRHSFFR